MLVTILKISINQRNRVGRWKANITTSKYISLTQPDLTMTTGKTERLVEIPAFATIDF